MSRTSSTPALSGDLLAWYRAHRRDLPWRRTADPYRIWLSEVILQQTRVDQGLAYWERFVAKWPTVQDLAAASEAEVLKMWQGLGYYSRARNLLAGARQVVNEHGGRFPDTHAGLLKLKGVGDYTAAAIASICFGRPDAVLDGNVFRVLARVYGIETPIDSTEGRKRFRTLAQQLIDPEQPGDHNQAMMELGATVCTPRNYTCLLCPLQPQCVAFATGAIDALPVKAGKVKVRERHFNYLHIRKGNGLYMRHRTGKDIWQGLWEPPMVETDGPVDAAGLRKALSSASIAGRWTITRHSGPVKHVLSHQVIQAVFWEVVPPDTWKAPAQWKAVTGARLRKLAVPRLVERWMEELP